MIKTVIFDFDGTLADCKKLHQDGFRAAVKKFSPDFDYDDEIVEGRPTREKIRILNTMGANLSPDKVNEIKQAHTQQHIPDYVFYSQDLYDAIEYLYKKGIKICLATNATSAFIERSLDIMGVTHFFTKINTATDFPAKPDTTTFFDCMRSTGSAISTTVIFEDSPVGIQCARATGATVVEVLDVEDTIKKIYLL